MSGYAKVHGSILRSTVWVGASKEVRLTWLTMLILADGEGYVASSVPGLAKEAGVTIEECEQALEVFRSPDKYSRTKDYEGRRIVDTDGGWLVLNHAKYRDYKTLEQVKNAERQARFKARTRARKSSVSVSADVTSVTGNRGNAATNGTPAAVNGAGKKPRKKPGSALPLTPVTESHVCMSDQSLEDPDPDPLNRPPKDLKAYPRESGVFDAPVLPGPSAMTVEVPAWWQPKPWHLDECRIAKLDIVLETKRFRTTHFQKAFPATEAGIDKRFSNWLVWEKNRSDTSQFVAGGAAVAPMPKRPTVPGLPDWVHPDHAALARAHGLRLRVEAAAFAKAHHPGVDLVRPVDLYRPFSEYLASRAEAKKRASA